MLNAATGLQSEAECEELQVDEEMVGQLAEEFDEARDTADIKIALNSYLDLPARKYDGLAEAIYQMMHDTKSNLEELAERTTPAEAWGALQVFSNSSIPALAQTLRCAKPERVARIITTAINVAMQGSLGLEPPETEGQLQQAVQGWVRASTQLVEQGTADILAPITNPHFAEEVIRTTIDM